MTREEMMDRMSVDEFFAWMAYSEVEPFGEARQDLRAGVLWSLLATVNSDSKKHPRGIGIDKYPLLQMTEKLDRPKVTSQDLFRTLKLLSDAYLEEKPS
jgi:hypothetical protein